MSDLGRIRNDDKISNQAVELIDQLHTARVLERPSVRLAEPLSIEDPTGLTKPSPQFLCRQPVNGGNERWNPRKGNRKGKPSLRDVLGK